MRRFPARRSSTPLAAPAAMLAAFAVLVLAGPSASAQCAGFEPAAFPAGLAADDRIDVLKTLDDGSGPALFAAGRFSTIGGVPAAGVARFDGAAWSPLGVGLYGVSDFAIYNDGSGPALYAAGQFTQDNAGHPLGYLARWNGASWQPVGGGLSNNSASLSVFNDGSGPQLYVSGSFESAGGVNAPHLARWNGAAWSPVANSSYGLSGGLEFAYDALRSRAVLRAWRQRNDAQATTWTWNGAAWSPISTGGPGPLVGAQMAPLSAQDQVLLFGGLTSDGGFTNNTWLFNGSTWSLAAPAIRPAPRQQHSMVYDAARQRVVLFGGRADDDNGATALADTWEWDGSAWTLSPALGPAPRWSAALAYDSVRHVVVLFGGYAFAGGAVPVGDTWEFDGSAWTQSSAVFPGVRAAMSMAFDPVRNRCIMHGGFDNTAFGDTWAYDGASWTQVALQRPDEADHRGPMVFDAARAVILQASPAGDTWAWDGLRWSLASPAIASDPQAMLVHDDGSGPALYIAGTRLSGVGGNLAGYVSRYSASGWSDVGAVYGDVRSLAIIPRPAGSTLVAGGSIPQAGGSTDASKVIQWNGSAWAPLGPQANRPEPDRLFAFSDNAGPSLFASGATGFVRLDADAWTTLSLTPHLAHGAAAFGSKLYLGGSFSCIDPGVVSPNLVRYASPCLPPAISSQPADQTAVFGQSVILRLAAAGTPPFAFQWRKNGVPIGGAVNVDCGAGSQLTLESVTVDAAGDYDCVVSSALGQITSNPAHVTVPFGPGVGPVAVSRILYPPQPAPDLDATYTDFSNPIVSDSGDVAFLGYYRRPGSQSTLSLSQWRNGATRVLVAPGLHAPGQPADVIFPFNGQLVQSFGAAADGAIYHIGLIAGNTTSGFSLWRWSDAGADLIALTGTPAVDDPSGLNYFNLNFARISDNGLLGFVATLDDRSSTGLWTWTPSGGTHALARSGNPAPGGDLYEYFTRAPVFSPDGRVAFAATLVSTPPAVRLGDAIWAGTPQHVELVARADSPAPGLPDGFVLGSLNLADHALSSSGDLYIDAFTTNQSQFRAAIFRWSGVPGQLVPVIARGLPAPGLPPGHTIFRPQTIRTNASGDLLFTSSMTLAEPFEDNTGLWFLDRASGQISLITSFRNVSVSFLPATWTLGALEAAGMNDSRQVVFSARIDARSLPFGTTGLFGWSPQLGLFPIAVPSNQLEIDSGAHRTLQYARLAASEGGFDSASSSSVASSGLVVFECGFTDGTRVIFSGQFGAFALRFFPCPADFNADTRVDPDDLADFIAAYFQLPSDPRADFNHDGFTDPDDLADFIALYFSSSCP